MLYLHTCIHWYSSISIWNWFNCIHCFVEIAYFIIIVWELFGVGDNHDLQTECTILKPISRHFASETQIIQPPLLASMRYICCANYFWGTSNIFAPFIISENCDEPISYNFSRERQGAVDYTVNVMAVDGIATQGVGGRTAVIFLLEYSCLWGGVPSQVGRVEGRIFVMIFHTL